MAGFDLQLDNDGTYSVATFFYFCVQIGIGLVVLFRYMVMRPVDMKKILFVDDKPAIGKVLSVYLGKENELVYFEDPVRAIEWLNEGNEPALIISDIRMPKMTGSEFLAYLKSNSLFKDIPVVMLSSEESTTERINLLEAGAEDFILKPFNPMELKARIKKFL